MDKNEQSVTDSTGAARSGPVSAEATAAEVVTNTLIPVTGVGEAAAGVPGHADVVAELHPGQAGAVLGTAKSMYIPVSRLVLGKDHGDSTRPHGHIVDSLKNAPLVHPVTVCRIAGTENYQVIDGGARVAAYRELGWTQIEVKELVADNADDAEMIGLEVNLCRRDPPDKAAAIARLAELHELKAPTKRGGDHRSSTFQASNQHGAGLVGSATERAADVAGVDARTVRRATTIAKRGTDDVKAALAAKQLTLNEAEKLAKLPAAEQPKELDELLHSKTDRPQFASMKKGLDAVISSAARKLPGDLTDGELDALLSGVDVLRRQLESLRNPATAASTTPTAQTAAEPTPMAQQEDANDAA